MFGLVRKARLTAANKSLRESIARAELAEIEVQQVAGANGDLGATIGAYRSVLVEHLTLTLRHENPIVRFHAATLLSELDFARLNIGPDVRVAPSTDAP